MEPLLIAYLTALILGGLLIKEEEKPKPEPKVMKCKL